MRLPDAGSWPDLLAALDQHGHAVIPRLLDPGECAALVALYQCDEAFRSRVVMARHNYGRGEYKYLRYPLPPPVASLRAALYPPLVSLANSWHKKLHLEPRFPAVLDDYLARCHTAGQQRPTPLILKYEAGDYNCLHQDLYGELVFPIQGTVLLSAPDTEFDGGEFLLIEQRPRMQSKGNVVRLRQGDAVLFAVRHRPVAGARGYFRVTMRHGVSTVRTGHRFTLGVIFHDAA
ncbi:MAG TPA: 2OG-Fe(II) oxygenase [Stellaceae bacterium]|jgi:hypothetical protein|nr:2OG-Fe(II) oxygenase [Stellaceae bacterium]